MTARLSRRSESDVSDCAGRRRRRRRRGRRRRRREGVWEGRRRGDAAA
jgi:hypothetical protein